MKGNYVQIEVLKLTLSNAINCMRSAEIPGFRDRFRFELGHDEGNNKYCQIDLTYKIMGN